MAVIGQGTLQSPWVLTEPLDFNFLRNMATKEGYVELGNDIDFEGQSFTPLSTSLSRFNYSFDGRGHTLKNLFIPVGSTGGQVGFLGNPNNKTELSNIKFENMYVQGVNSTVNNRQGGMLAMQLTGGQFNNIYIQGTLEVINIDYLGRLGVLGGMAHELQGFQAHNIYTEVTFNIPNITPQNATVKYIGGLVGNGNNYGDFNPQQISNIVMNNTLNVAVPSNWSIGRFYGQKNYDISYKNVYVNSSHWEYNVTENIPVYTDETILQPLTLDTKHWVQRSGEIPQLITFDDSSGVIESRELIVTFKGANVSVGVSKSVNRTTTLIPFKTFSIDSQALIKGSREIDIQTKEYSVNVNVSFAKEETMEISVPFNSIGVTAQTNKQSKVTAEVIPFNPVSVSISVRYPLGDEIPVYAYVYAIEGKSNAYKMQSYTTIYAIQNNTSIGVI